MEQTCPVQKVASHGSSSTWMSHDEIALQK